MSRLSLRLGVLVCIASRFMPLPAPEFWPGTSIVPAKGVAGVQTAGPRYERFVIVESDVDISYIRNT